VPHSLVWEARRSDQDFRKRASLLDIGFALAMVAAEGPSVK
jgi:hypothetical protein